MKEASPSPLEIYCKWQNWMPEFTNLLSSVFWVYLVPLYYIIREDKGPNHTITFQDFIDKCVACALLNGPSYDDHKMSVHQFYIFFLIQERMSEVWSKPVAQFKGGRRDVTALHGNSSGKENAYGCITVAERLTFRLHGFFCKLNWVNIIDRLNLGHPGICRR